MQNHQLKQCLSLNVKTMIINLLVIVAEAYLGCVIGAIIYGLPNVRPDLQLFEPIGLVATIGLAALTPVVRIVLLLVVGLSACFVFFKMHKLYSMIPFTGFVIVGYLLRLMWKTQ